MGYKQYGGNSNELISLNDVENSPSNTAINIPNNGGRPSRTRIADLPALPEGQLAPYQDSYSGKDDGISRFVSRTSPHGYNRDIDNSYAHREHYQPPEPVQIYQTIPFNCLDVAQHIKNCEICKQIYSTDKSAYYIIIVVLAILVILLLKRVLEI